MKDYRASVAITYTYCLLYCCRLLAPDRPLLVQVRFKWCSSCAVELYDVNMARATAMVYTFQHHIRN